MRYVALACDYDGTIATDGRVPDDVLGAVERLRESGRRTILVTGRELEDLRRTFERIDVFDRVVAENGALLFDPASRAVRELAGSPPESFERELRDRGVRPLSVGRVIVATEEPNETIVLEAIRDLGLELQVIFNKGAVMVLPTSVNKATGLAAALDDLRLSHHNVVGVGDAENDHAFLDLCELSVAVGNALPAVKDRCDLVTDGERGEGVVELIGSMLEDDLESLDERVARHDIALGRRDGDPVTIRPYRANVLVAGPSGSGKSTLVTAFLEGLVEHGYQFCLIDPEGDYDSLERAAVLGTADHPPTVEESLELIDDPDTNLVLNLLGIRLDDRPAFLEALLPRFQELRAKSGRPHWIVVDEAHHLLPASLQRAGELLPKRVGSLVLITVHPDSVNRDALEEIGLVITTSAEASQTIATFAGAIGSEPPPIDGLDPGEGEAAAWFRFLEEAPFAFEAREPRGERRRHLRKYAEGDLDDHSFSFRGPEDRLNLRVQNLTLFSQIAEGIDDETWTWHLERGDYERWFREAIKDDGLAEVAARAAGESHPAASRRLILEAISERYTAPA